MPGKEVIIIGICGKLGSGKDYYMNNVVIPLLKRKNLKYLNIGFADQLKVNIMSKHRISYNDIYVTKTLKSRLILQKEGTEIGRNIDENIWVKYLSNWITVHKHRNDIDVFIINDVQNDLPVIFKCFYIEYGSKLKITTQIGCCIIILPGNWYF